MRAVQHGRIAGPAVAIVGVWDPVLSSHVPLLGNLRDRAAAAGLTSVAVLIDPAPGAASGFARQYDTFGWPVYDSVPARIGLIRHLGLDAVVVVRFRKIDFGATAAAFLDTVRERVCLEELWLGAVQQLGPGIPGSPPAVADYAHRHGFRLTMLPRAPLGTYDVRYLLASGRVREAVHIVGHPPTWRRPRSGVLRLPWRPGRYQAVALDSPERPPDGNKINIALAARSNESATMCWPDPGIRYLAFTAGPADLGGGGRLMP